MKEYVFNSLTKCLQLQVADDGRKIIKSHLATITDQNLGVFAPNARTGEFENQGSSHPWTWAWTTDNGLFEIWNPSGICLKLESSGNLTLFSPRTYNLEAPKELYIGKTGWFSYGIVGVNSDGSKTSLIKDSYPFWDALLNVTYDGLCEDEDFYPLVMMGRELSRRLSIPFHESIRD